jgi:hypothetical protein
MKSQKIPVTANWKETMLGERANIAKKVYENSNYPGFSR